MLPLVSPEKEVRKNVAKSFHFYYTKLLRNSAKIWNSRRGIKENIEKKKTKKNNNIMMRHSISIWTPHIVYWDSLAPHASSCLQKFKRPTEEEDAFFSFIISVLYSDSPCLSSSFLFFFSVFFSFSHSFASLVPPSDFEKTEKKEEEEEEEEEEEMTKAKSGLTSI